jgi:FAD synthase
MQIIRDISAIKPEPCVATIGFFDGVHAGHRYLIQQVKEIAAAKGLRSALVTFPVHPRKVMNATYRPGTTIKTVCSVRQESIDQLDEENKGRADFYICVPEDMTSTY